ncbi:carbonate dehydratase [Alkalilimnicola ehrlichii MLHE-1]|uniref:Carbonic anhydrase n=1 Tax=Alkalilimnicola ehrlichii (strain ATCC BAA-1101 / DSM 17681 / MLHE-1) TaxID=187272 RepID=Q0A5X6_ALKEH|nr:carbonate dehydratase [Alkalilimnicola ehrlichii]ABI57761.1 Carbonate dehydratase [Alkalilimnicola ehrlichii MLHE-1]
MPELKDLLANNQAWAERKQREDPAFFQRLAREQKPEYLWIGCSDSRVPASEIVDMPPGELFVHRNIANVVTHADVNCLSVLQYAVDVLKVRHIIVCGHYGCGGVKAALSNQYVGFVNNWLRHIEDVYHLNEGQFRDLPEERQVDLLCELNVQQSVRNVCRSTVVQQAWQRGQPLSVHGWIYGLASGRLKDLGLHFHGPECLPVIDRLAMD